MFERFTLREPRFSSSCSVLETPRRTELTPSLRRHHADKRQRQKRRMFRFFTKTEIQTETESGLIILRHSSVSVGLIKSPDGCKDKSINLNISYKSQNLENVLFLTDCYVCCKHKNTRNVFRDSGTDLQQQGLFLDLKIQSFPQITVNKPRTP